MIRYVVLLQFTEQGVSGIKDSTERAEGFRKNVEAAGGSVEFLSWTLGNVDGVLVLAAPDEATAVSLVLGLRKQAMVQTTMLRAFDTAEFGAITAKIV